MERSGTASVPEVVERYLAIDEKGAGLRATWRPAQGFTNLSLWRGDACVETFHLSPDQMGDFIAFLATSLASACPPRTVLRAVPPHEPRNPRRGHPLRVAVLRSQEATARVLDAAAKRIRQPRSD